MKKRLVVIGGIIVLAGLAAGLAWCVLRPGRGRCGKEHEERMLQGVQVTALSGDVDNVNTYAVLAGGTAGSPSSSRACAAGMILSNCAAFETAVGKACVTWSLLARVAAGDHGALADVSRLALTNRMERDEWLRVIRNVVVSTATYELILAVCSNIHAQCDTAAARYEVNDVAARACKEMYEYNRALSYVLGDEGARADDVYACRLRDENIGHAALMYAELLDEDGLLALAPQLRSSRSEHARFSYYAALWQFYAQQGKIAAAQRIGEQAQTAFSKDSTFHASACEMNTYLYVYQNARATPRVARARIEYLRRKAFGQQTSLDMLTEMMREP